MIPLGEFSELAETVKKASEKGPVYYYPNWGNWGDALIHRGTKKFLDNIKLKYHEWNTLNKLKLIVPYIIGGTVLYRGGGGFCKVHSSSEQVVRNLAKRFRVIVLPSTYEFNLNIKNVVFFRRDEFESKKNMPSSHFCHDLAFYLGKQSIESNVTKGPGYFFRTDGESSDKIILPSSNVDISRQGHHLSSIEPLFEELSQYSVIHTDRLHVSIAGCLLSKEVHLYPGSYFKNKAIYQSSMKSYFDNIHFREKFNVENHLLPYQSEPRQ